MIEELIDDAATRYWLDAGSTRLVEFHSRSCGPCRMIEPSLRHAASALEGRIAIGKADIEAAPALAARFSVRSTPTFVVLRGGQAVATRTGALTLTALMQWLQACEVADGPGDETLNPDRTSLLRS